MYFVHNTRATANNVLLNIFFFCRVLILAQVHHYDYSFYYKLFCSFVRFFSRFLCFCCFKMYVIWTVKPLLCHHIARKAQAYIFYVIYLHLQKAWTYNNNNNKIIEMLILLSYEFKALLDSLFMCRYSKYVDGP